MLSRPRRPWYDYCSIERPALSVNAMRWIEYNAKLLVTFTPTLLLATHDNPAAGKGTAKRVTCRGLEPALPFCGISAELCCLSNGNDGVNSVKVEAKHFAMLSCRSAKCTWPGVLNDLHPGPGGNASPLQVVEN